MQSFNVLSLAPHVNDWLANSRHPRILHIFDCAYNLINERREVLSVVTPQIGDGPFNLVVEDNVLFSQRLSLQSPISNSANQLNLGNLIIDTANAKLWSPRPDWELLHAQRDDILRQIMSLRGAQRRSNPHHREEIASGGVSTQSVSTTTLATTLPITKYQFFNSLISSLANADLPNCINSAKQLAGLGIGLTPAGDDFILGAVLAVWIIHPPEIARVLAKEISNTAAPLTTSLSAAWLRSAGKGEAGISWHKFFDALISANPLRIQETIENILAVGHTSGADALAGFIGLFTYWGEHCSNLWEYNQP